MTIPLVRTFQTYFDESVNRNLMAAPLLLLLQSMRAVCTTELGEAALRQADFDRLEQPKEWGGIFTCLDFFYSYSGAAAV